jgi:hypothetical protein
MKDMRKRRTPGAPLSPVLREIAVQGCSIFNNSEEAKRIDSGINGVDVGL